MGTRTSFNIGTREAQKRRGAIGIVSLPSQLGSTQQLERRVKGRDEFREHSVVDWNQQNCTPKAGNPPPPLLLVFSVVRLSALVYRVL
jgi:hypothetical protein